MKFFFKASALVSVVLFSALAMAGTTGNIQGTVTDNNGAGLPGVTVSITSPNLQGSRTLVTDSNGKFRAVFLPPGAYELTATLTGFQTQKAAAKVNLDSTATINFGLTTASVEEELIVTAERPIIDQTSTTAGANLTEDFFTKVATGRSAQSLMMISPGVISSDASNNLRIYGSSGTENQYVLDGVNTTGIENNDNVTSPNFDFIQEIQIKTGGYEAEFGRATGGYVNLITKSGGNEFEGSVYGFFDDREQRASQRASLGSTFTGTDRSDYGFTLGGPIMKDKLWFFVGFNPNSRKSYAMPLSLEQNVHGGVDWQSIRGDEIVTSDFSQDKWVAKFTYQMNENNTLTFSANSDPSENYTRDPSGFASTDRIIKFDTMNYILKWNSILSSVFTLDASYGVHEEDTSYSQADSSVGADMPMWFDYWSTPTSNGGGLGWYIKDRKGSRNDFNFKVGAFLGNHDLKAGIQYETTEFDDTRSYGGAGRGLGTTYLIFGYYGIIRTYGQQNADGSYSVIDAQSSVTQNNYTAFFLQDSWTVTPSLTLNLGLRVEEQELENSVGETYHTFDDNVMPRFGFTWDFKGDGTSKVYGSWGRFFQNIPMDINNRAAAPEIIMQRYYWMDDFSQDFLDWDLSTVEAMAAQDPWRVRGFGSGATPISTNTKATNQDEWILGIDYEFKPSWTFGFRHISRSLNEAIEDFSFDDGNNYYIGNPGKDTTFTNGDSTLMFYDNNGVRQEWAAGADVSISPDMVGLAAPKREYKGYEFVLRKAYRDNMQFQFSYLNSSVKGNYEGGVLEDGQVDPGITSTFDLVSTTINGDGILPTEREHDFKFDGSYDFDFGLTTGLSYRYTSGKGVSALGEPDVGNGAYGQFHLLRRGTAGQLPGMSTVDLHLEYSYRFSGRMELSVYGDVFNLFNFQEVRTVNEQFSLGKEVEDMLTDPSAPWNEGKEAIVIPESDLEGHAWDTTMYASRYYQWMEGRFNSLNELTAWYDENGIEMEDTYMDPFSYQSSRRTRFGVRFRF